MKSESHVRTGMNSQDESMSRNSKKLMDTNNHLNLYISFSSIIPIASSAGFKMSDSLDELFKRVLSAKIFINRDLLRPDYIPDELPHREKQILRLAETL
ncbi:MAG: hypothetical protein QXG70_00400, partial [Candidatus Methanomethylicaceae archaeon]